MQVSIDKPHEGNLFVGMIEKLEKVTDVLSNFYEVFKDINEKSRCVYGRMHKNPYLGEVFSGNLNKIPESLMLDMIIRVLIVKEDEIKKIYEEKIKAIEEKLRKYHFKLDYDSLSLISSANRDIETLTEELTKYSDDYLVSIGQDSILAVLVDSIKVLVNNDEKLLKKLENKINSLPEDEKYFVNFIKFISFVLHERMLILDMNINFIEDNGCINILKLQSFIRKLQDKILKECKSTEKDVEKRVCEKSNTYRKISMLNTLGTKLGNCFEKVKSNFLERKFVIIIMKYLKEKEYWALDNETLEELDTLIKILELKNVDWNRTRDYVLNSVIKIIEKKTDHYGFYLLLKMMKDSDFINDLVNTIHQATEELNNFKEIFENIIKDEEKYEEVIKDPNNKEKLVKVCKELVPPSIILNVSNLMIKTLKQ